MSTKIIWQMSIFLGLGTVLILAGAVVGAFWSSIFSYLVKKELALTPTSRSYGLWKETPLPLYMDFYMFNWTNPEETLRDKAKPHFVQMGPYVFRERHSKVNLTWNDDNATITFLNMRQWHFDPDLSNGSLSDQVTNINVISMTLATLIEKYVPKWFMKFIYDFIKADEPIHITKTVDELIFSGYDDPFLRLASKLKRFVPEIDLPFDKFGWFYGRNMSKTFDGIFNMHTGVDNINKLGLLSAWNYSDHVQFFKGSCGQVNGSTGELWPVNIAQKSNATVFSNEICSSFTLDRSSRYRGDVGVDGIEFTGGPKVFSNESCWCVSGTTCQPYGVRDISTCRYGAPAFISYPHFYLAHPSYNEMVSGLSPNASIHQFKMAFDEHTGVPVEVHARFQINILSQPIALMNLFNRSFPQAMFPMFWFEQRTMLAGELKDQIVLLNRVGGAGKPIFFSILAIGIVLGCVGIYLSYAGGWRKRRPHLLLNDNSSQASSAST